MDDKERNWFISRMEDLADRADQTGYMIFSDFLDGYQLSLLRDMQRHLTTEVTFYGGYEDAERRMASFYPSFLQVQTEDFPIEALLITPKAPQFLTKAPGHRDYLGALMGLGIKREKLGDILLQEQGAVVFVREDMASYIQEGVTSVGAADVKVTVQDRGIAVKAPEGKRILVSLASLRLDALLSKGFAISRGDASNWIAAGKVQKNWRDCTAGDEPVREGDVITLRGMGRIKCIEEKGRSKSGRIQLMIERFS